MSSLLKLETYDPNHLLDETLKLLSLQTDVALAHRLKIAPPVLSKIRHFTLPVGATLLIRLHEETQLSIRDLRSLMGDYRVSFRSIE